MVCPSVATCIPSGVVHQRILVVQGCGASRNYASSPGEHPVPGASPTRQPINGEPTLAVAEASSPSSKVRALALRKCHHYIIAALHRWDVSRPYQHHLAHPLSASSTRGRQASIASADNIPDKYSCGSFALRSSWVMHPPQRRLRRRPRAAPPPPHLLRARLAEPAASRCQLPAVRAT